MQTTYQHDFIPPNSLMAIKDINFTNNNKTEMSSKDKHLCCKPLLSQTKPTLNTNTNEKELLKIAESCKNTNEWTGIAPMGILITPRIIPENTIDNANTKKDVNSCFEEQPNKFLQQLSNKYPNLYEKLKNKNPDDIQNQLYTNCFKSTYQIDYGNEPEYAKGLYINQTVNFEPGKLIKNSQFSDPCAIEDIPVIYN